MLFLRCNENPYRQLSNGINVYRIWFDLDARHETFIEVYPFDDYEDIILRVQEVKRVYSIGGNVDSIFTKGGDLN